MYESSATTGFEKLNFRSKLPYAYQVTTRPLPWEVYQLIIIYLQSKNAFADQYVFLRHVSDTITKQTFRVSCPDPAGEHFS